jgi:hypothetical protein
MTKYYTVAEIAKLLPRADGKGGGLGLSRTYALVKDESLRAEKASGKTVICQAELDRFLAEYQPCQIKRPISFDDAVDRVVAVMDGRATATEVAQVEPEVSVSYISLLRRGLRWPEVREAALRFVAARAANKDQTVSPRRE